MRFEPETGNHYLGIWGYFKEIEEVKYRINYEPIRKSGSETLPKDQAKLENKGYATKITFSFPDNSNLAYELAVKLLSQGFKVAVQTLPDKRSYMVNIACEELK